MHIVQRSQRSETRQQIDRDLPDPELHRGHELVARLESLLPSVLEVDEGLELQFLVVQPPRRQLRTVVEGDGYLQNFYCMNWFE